VDLGRGRRFLRHDAGWEQYPCWTDAARDSITRYDAGGGRLSVVSHDTGWDFTDSVNSPDWSAARQAWFNNELHETFVEDPTSWTANRGVSGDPISGAYLSNIQYQAFRAGGAGDAVTSNPGTGTGAVDWLKQAPIPVENCGVRWTAGTPSGSPDSAVWGGTATKQTINNYEWTRLNASVADDTTRASILDKTLVWLVGREHPLVTVTAPNGGETFTGSTVAISWTEVTGGGTGVGSRTIEYSDDAGQSWHLVTSAAGASPYNWDVTSVPNGNSYLVRTRVVDNGHPALTGQDASNATFTINRPGGDTRGPIVRAGSAITTPNPAVAPGHFVLAATIDDSHTGNSNIAGAEWSLGAHAAPPGSGHAMSGAFTTPVVAVHDTVDAATLAAGYVPAWVRGMDAAGQWGAADSLTIFVNGGATSVAGFTGGPGVFALAGAVPNPFNPRTVIRFSIPSSGHADLVIFDVSGRSVRRLANGSMSAGMHEVSWDGRDDAGRSVASGVYFCRLTAGTHSAEQKMVLMK